MNIIDILKNRELTNYPKRIFFGRGKQHEEYNWVNIDWYPPYIYIESFDESKSVNEIINFYQDSYEVITSNDKNGEYETIVNENETFFKISLGRNKNTGLFLDSAPLRSWISKHSKNKKILNLFSYTCTLGAVAMKSGAHSCMNVDMSQSSLNRGKSNYKLNELEVKNIDFQKKNILKSLNYFSKKDPFDIIIIDPPPRQAKSFYYKKDYIKILKRVESWSHKNTTIVLTKNDTLITEEVFIGWLHENTSLKILDKLFAPKYFEWKNTTEQIHFYICGYTNE